MTGTKATPWAALRLLQVFLRLPDDGQPRPSCIFSLQWPKTWDGMKQCEDEIAFDDMAVGAGQMGIRAMTRFRWRLRFDDRGVGLAGMLGTRWSS